MPPDPEARAIAKLIAQINDLDALRDQVGRRVVALFLIVFAFALSLLVYVALDPGPRPQPTHRPMSWAAPPGPQAGPLNGSSHLPSVI